MKKLYRDILQLLQQEESLTLATILSSTGSTPRVAGAEMIVRADGSIIGTIGGGMLEAETRRMCLEVHRTGQRMTRLFNLSDSDRSGMNMVCGGQQEVFIDWLNAEDPKILQVYSEIVRLLVERSSAVLLTQIDGENGVVQGSHRWLVHADGLVTGDSGLPQAGKKLLAGYTNTRYPKTVALEGVRFLVEPICLYGTVYIFGAGHVSQKLALLTEMVDFRTVVLDDREEYANWERFPGVDQVIVLDSFDSAFNDLEIDRDSYVVIVTRGHVHDSTVLVKALRTEAGYIGMIGSRKKRYSVYQALLRQGFSEHDLERLHSPIGLDIGADTPEEIGVSIVAELIKTRVALY